MNSISSNSRQNVHMLYITSDRFKWENFMFLAVYTSTDTLSSETIYKPA